MSCIPMLMRIDLQGMVLENVLRAAENVVCSARVVSSMKGCVFRADGLKKGRLSFNSSVDSLPGRDPWIYLSTTLPLF